MKKLALTLAVICLTHFTQAQGLISGLPINGQVTITSDKGILYDDALLFNDYSNNVNGTYTILPSDLNMNFALNLNVSMEVYDTLYVYDGAVADENHLILKTTSGTYSGTKYSTQHAFTVKMVSDASMSTEGFNITYTAYHTIKGEYKAMQVYSQEGAGYVNAGSTLAVPLRYMFTGGYSVSASYGIYLSADSLWDTGDSLLIPGTAGGINDSVYAPILNVTIPSSTIAGNYYILFFLDNNWAIDEVTESDNVSYLPFTVGTGKNLAVENNVAKITIGQALTLPNAFMTVYNRSNSPTSHRFQLMLSTDSVIDALDIPLIDNIVNVSTTTNITVPAALSNTVTPGLYYLIGTADVNGTYTESSEGDNVSILPLEIKPAMPDFAFNDILSVYESAKSFGYGGGTDIMVKLVNAGLVDVTSTYAIRYYISTDSLYDAGDTQIGSSSVTTNLSANTITTLTAGASFPSTIVNGYYYLIVVADPLNAIAELNESNNVLIRPVYVWRDQDLLVKGPLPSGKFPVATVTPSDLSYGQALVVLNQSARSSTNPTLKIYFSTDTILSVGDQLLSSTVSASYTNVGNKTYFPGLQTPSISIPVGLAYGTYYIIYYVDKNSTSATEVDSTNNIAWQQVNYLPPYVDLVTKEITITQVVAPGSIFGVLQNSTVRNSGEVPAGPFTRAIYLSTDKFFDAGDILLDSSHYAGLNANFGVSVSANLTIPPATAPGLYYLLNVADAEFAVSELDEANNVSYDTLMVSAPLPDFDFMTLTNPTQIVRNSYNTLQAKVRNSGTLAQPFNLAFYLSYNNSLDSFDLLLDTIQAGMLQPGTNFTYSKPVFLSSSTVLGPRYIFAKVDYDNMQAEYNEGNNVYSYAVDVTEPEMDFDVTNFTTSNTSFTNGGTGTVTYTVSEYSNAVYYPATCKVFYSSNITLDGSDVLLDSTVINLTQAVNSQTITRTFNIPVNLVATTGTGRLILMVDHDSLFNENDETTNSNVKTLSSTFHHPVYNIQVAGVDWNINNSTCSGGSGAVVFTLENTTNYNQSTTACRIYLSLDNVLSANDVLLHTGTYSVGSLSPYSVSVNPVTIPASTTPGNYRIIVWADYNNVVTETSETDNLVSTSLTVYDCDPELTCGGISFAYDTVFPGQTVFYGSQLTNTSTMTNATNVLYEFMFSEDNLPDASDLVVYSNTTTLNSGQLVNVNNSTTIPVSLQQNMDYYIVLQVDPNNDVTESNEANNVSYKKFYLKEPNPNSIANIETLQYLHVWPTPAKNNFNIAVPVKGTLAIHNLQGQLVHTKQVAEGNCITYTNDWAEGFYILTLTTDAGVYSTKISVTR